ncbi:MAG: hypothetical protein H3C47_11545 [Candidatus Cloacimonetes bacterium]|nr:hypothetical protein [Candidatus Cloacimonadota bacterium]
MNFDPFSMHKNMTQQWEKMMGEYLSQQVRDPAFMQVLSQNMQQMLDMEQLIQKQLQPILTKLNLPTKESLEKLYESLHTLESKNLDLEEEVMSLKQELVKIKSKPKASSTKKAKKD